MMDWLKSRLRQWLAEPEARVDELDCVIEGKCQRVRIMQAIGMNLAVRTPLGEYLISSGQCVDPKQFWKAWDQRTPAGKYSWPDGTPFKPPGAKRCK